MKRKLISLIVLLGITVDEVLITIDMGGFEFHSIEWDRKRNKILLHKFVGEEFDLEFDYDELPKKIKKEIYLFLLRETLN